MDRIKLLTATIITIILLAGMALVARLIEKTDGLFLLILVVIALVAGIYVSL